ncbi:trace amine-associated receptor 1-like [Stylophora pistillata]|uniref:trace amine-associated receptor 1-like n=1 Tax=Stylophora pistillata TaxID=50429 RepID=UPI000C04D426|nr:trace amine-associated receptor 1-like [Stylophora pistillata]
MELWVWILGWYLCILTMVMNGFVIFLVCRKRQLRTKTNTFIVSLAVADFCVGMIAAPSRLLCKMVDECISDKEIRLLIYYVWGFFIYASGSNLLVLVFERYIAVVKPLKYLTFMKRSRVIQMVLTSWGVPFIFILTLLSISLNSIDHWMTIIGYLHLLFEVILCVTLIFCLVSMFLVVYKQNTRDRTLARQLHFNQRVAKVKTQNTSAVKWLAFVTCMFLLCYGILMRCSFLILTGHECGNDIYYKVPLQVVNSGINPIVYAFFKRDIKQECKRLLFKRRRGAFLLREVLVRLDFYETVPSGPLVAVVSFILCHCFTSETVFVMLSFTCDTLSSAS